MCLPFFLYNTSQIRAALNLPKVILSQNQLALFEEKNFLKTIFESVETIFLDPVPTQDMDLNSLIISSLAQEPNPDQLLSFLSRVPVRDPMVICTGFANFLEKDHQQSLIRLAMDREFSYVLSVFNEDHKLRARVFQIKNAQRAPAWARLGAGYFTPSDSHDQIIIEDFTPGTPESGILTDGEESDEV